MMPVEVVTGLLVRDRKVLMCERRADKIYPLHWEFPGGKVEAGESLLQALQRELQEELKIHCNAARFFFDDVMTYSNGITYHVTFFVTSSFAGEPINTEFNNIDWFDMNELKNILHLSGNAQIIERLTTQGIPSE